LTYSSVPKDCRPTSFLLSMNFAGTVIFDPLQGAVSLQFLQRPYIYIYIYIHHFSNRAVSGMEIKQKASMQEEDRRYGNYVTSMR
jgi:hypothetical protein